MQTDCESTNATTMVHRLEVQILHSTITGRNQASTVLAVSPGPHTWEIDTMGKKFTGPKHCSPSTTDRKSCEELRNTYRARGFECYDIRRDIARWNSGFEDGTPIYSFLFRKS